jgi:two-component system sensor histidine kinase YesM
MDRETLEKLNAGEIPASSRGGMGLKNVKERIHLFFGDEYDLVVFSNPGSGTVVRFTIPLIKESDL